MNKQLTKSNDRIVAGVFGGIAEYFGWDKAWTRIGGGVLAFCTQFGLIMYLIAAIVMPSKPKHDPNDDGEYRQL